MTDLSEIANIPTRELVTELQKRLDIHEEKINDNHDLFMFYEQRVKEFEARMDVLESRLSNLISKCEEKFAEYKDDNTVVMNADNNWQTLPEHVMNDSSFMYFLTEFVREEIRREMSGISISFRGGY